MANQFVNIFQTGPVTALNFYSNDILTAGIGSSLLFYSVNSGDLLCCKETLPCHNIHGICHSRSAGVLVKDQYVSCCFGGKSVRVWQYDQQQSSLELLGSPCEFEDWIWDVCWLAYKPCGTLALALGHNSAVHWDWQTAAVLHKVKCEETCIIYCARFLGRCWADLVIAAGTVFNQVVLWAMQGETTDEGKLRVLHRLKGHQGVIFSIEYHAELHRLCSVSDDRSIRLWQLSAPDDWRRTEFTELHVLYGHSARVWSARLMRDQFVSVGEDSTCCVWDYQGNVRQKFKGHKGKSIWSLAVDESSKLVATGGGDHSVRVWKMGSEVSPESEVKTQTLHPPLEQDDFARTVTLRDYNRVLVMTNKGCLYEKSLEEACWVTLMEDLEFKSYTVLSVSPDHRVIALGSINGALKLLVHTGQSEMITLREEPFKGRIFSVVWLNNNTLLTTGPEGEIILWELTVSEGVYGVTPVNRFLLTGKARQRWVTSACLTDHHQLLVCGDRNGTLSVYRHGIPHSRHQTTTPECPEFPIQTLPGYHGKAGVTYVGFHDNHVYSCGRDGHYSQHQVDENGLCSSRAKKVMKGFDWLDRLAFTQGDILVLGFHSSHFVIWSKNRNQRLAEIECGGGHRTWGCHMTPAGPMRFVFLKSSDIILYETQVSSNQLILKESLHGRELSDVRHIKSVDCSVGRVELLLTCSEDTDMSLISLTSCVAQPNKLSVLQTIKGHISSVRAICLVEIASCNSNSDQTYVMFSAGGRAQMKVWQLTIHVPVFKTTTQSEKLGCESDNKISSQDNSAADLTGPKRCDNSSNICDKSVSTNYELLSSHMLRNPGKKTSKACKEDVYDLPPETRYMSLTAFCESVLDVGRRGRGLFVGAACSDAFLRLFLFNMKRRTFSCVAHSPFHQHCVLKVGHFVQQNPHSGLRCVILYTGATDGKVAFWDVSDLVRSCSTSGLMTAGPSQNTGPRSRVPSHPGGHTVTDLGSPVFVLANHQSGINSIDIHHYSGGEYLLVTGGDDNAVCFRTLTVTSDRSGGSGGGLVFRAGPRSDQINAHSAQVTGARILDDHHVLTASIDQRLLLWEVTCSQTALKVEKRGWKFVNVSDVSNIDVWPLSDGGYGIAVCGEGLQVLHLRLPGSLS